MILLKTVHFSHCEWECLLPQSWCFTSPQEGRCLSLTPGFFCPFSHSVPLQMVYLTRKFWENNWAWVVLLKPSPSWTRIERDTFRIERDTPMFITALFTIARTWKQSRCPLANQWIRKLWYIYTMEYYSAIKMNAFESVLMRWMKLEPIIQNEVSQKEKHQYSILMHIYGI